ncbi:tail fiber domain-containing protein [Pseudomonadota bacterium]
MKRSEVSNDPTVNDNSQRDVDKGGLKPYQKPALRYFGSVTKLTEGTGSDANESGSSGMTGNMRSTGAGSDRSIKTAIVRIGTHPINIGLYLFDYKSEYQSTYGVGRQFGVMADEVEQIMPEAVSEHPDGYKLVDYAMLGIYRSIH